MKNRIFRITLLGIALLCSFSFANNKKFRPRITIKVDGLKDVIGDTNIDIGTSYITADKARDIALKHAKVSKSKAQNMRTYLDWEDGVRIYDIEFYSNSVKYEYDIDATNGKIISYSKRNRSRNSNIKRYIGEERAKKIALSKVPGANNSHIKKIKMNEKDDRMIYEGEIKYRSREYEFKIDALTGKILEWETD